MIANIYLEGDVDIEIKGIKETKFVYLMVDIKYQIMLMEKNVTVFQDPKNAIHHLEDYFRSKIREFDYSVNIEPLVAKRKFWNYVKTAKEIYQLSLEYSAPNFSFFGHDATKDVLKEIKDATNNEEFEMAFKNKDGKLKVAKNALGSWIEYVREVGGKYLLKFKNKDGIVETKTSDDDTAKAFIERKKTGTYTDEEIEDIALKMESINSLEKRDNNDEEE